LPDGVKATADMIPGHATPEATRAYAEASGLPEGHWSDFLRTRIRLSSIGVGTFPGAADHATDVEVAAVVSRALRSGLNVVDTAAHYRWGRALAAVGAGLHDALARGVAREAVFVVSKGGFVTFPEGRPPDPEAWFAERVEARGLGRREDLAKGVHCLSPEYLLHQLDLSREAIGVETLDAFLVDQPEVHIPLIGKERLNRKLLAVFTALERAVREGRLRFYGIATFHAMRVETDNPLFQSLTSMLGLAEKAAREASGDERARHHFRLVTIPFNLAMTEGFTRFSHATGQGNIASTLQAAHQLRVYVMGSHALAKGRLAREDWPPLAALTPALAGPAQRAIQFARSTPGLGTALVGMRRLAHLEDALAVARVPPLEKKAYLSLYERSE